jgi:hypothetical protein
MGESAGPNIALFELSGPGSSGTSGTGVTSGSSGTSTNYYGTSTDSIDPSTLTIGGLPLSIQTQTGLSYVVGQQIQVYNSPTLYFTGTVASYDSGTGILSLTITSTVGSGATTSWTIFLSNGINGSSGTSGSAGSSGTSGVDGTSGTSGTSPPGFTSGTSGTSGETGPPGANGVSTGGAVGTGVARAIALYPALGTALDDTFTQNSSFTSTILLGTATLTASRTLTIPVTDAAASFIMSVGSQTLNGAVSLAAAGSLTTAQLTFSGSTNNWISFGTTGSNAPTVTNRSVGTKIVLNQVLSGVAVDNAIGVNSTTTWISAPTTSAAISFYGGTTLLGSFTGNGLTLNAAGSTTVPNLSISGTTISWITFGTLTGAPAFSTRNGGTKIVLYPSIGGAAVDYAIGMNNVGPWISTASTAGRISFYGGVTELGFFTGTGLTLANTAGPQLTFGGATNNFISFANSAGTANPTASTRSAGTKILFGSYVGATQLDSSIGFNTSTASLWFSMPGNGSYEIGFYTIVGTTVTKVFSIGSTGTTHSYGTFTVFDSLLYTTNTTSTQIRNTSGNIAISTKSFINMGTTGTRAVPALVGGSYSARSLGTRIILHATGDLATADAAIGVDAAGPWFSTGAAAAGSTFKWYGGATLAMTLTGAGVLTLVGALNLRAGSATAGTAPIYFTSGTQLAAIAVGAMEYDGVNLKFHRTASLRDSILMADAVNSVSPTSPNRTITVNINGTLYYLHAKTTND